MAYRLVVMLAALTAVAGMAKPALADQSSDCERHGLAFFKKQGAAITRLQIERTQFPEVNRYDDKVGSQFVSSEIFGKVRVTETEGTKTRRYLCLHDGKRAVYFGLVD
ncbi:MAG: hypothetical protein ACRCWO_04715 [Bosea sp. (in: a-proteobacteria)]